VSGATIWITGLSGAGKTTLAGLVVAELRRRGQPVELLDGDEVRPHLFSGLPLLKEQRNEVIRRLGFVCNLLSKHGVYAIAAAVAPHREIRDEVRAAADGRFFEVYLATPFADCVRRDVRGMYAKALAGEIENFPGISVPYEPPLAPELTLLTHTELPEASAGRIIAALEQRGLLDAEEPPAAVKFAGPRQDE
jgi:adenylyl-sulfate kinase